MIDDSLLLEERRGPIAILTINRPEKRNALNLTLIHTLSARLTALASERELRVLVLRGAGEKAFVAGADIAELEARDAEDSLAGINSGLFRQVEEFPVPVIAALHGWVLGGGLELAISCDVRIAGASARFGQPEVSLGIMPAAGAMHRLPPLVGMGFAKDLILTGRILDAQEALGCGLVSRVVSDDELMNEVLATAHAIAGMAPLATRLAKRVINTLCRVRPDTAAALESSAQAILFDSAEKHARMQAFLAKQASKRQS